VAFTEPCARSSRHFAVGVALFSFLTIAGCNSILGNGEGRLKENSSGGAGGGSGVDASDDSRAVGGGSIASALDAAPGKDASIDSTDEPPSSDAKPDGVDEPSAEGGPLGDISPPTIVSVTPVAGAADVEPVPTIAIEFSEAVAPDAISAQTIMLQGLDGGPVQYQSMVAGNMVRLVPATPLVLATKYTLTVTTGIRDLAGNALRDAHAFDFTTRDGRWSPPHSLSTTGTGANIAIDGQGNALVSWIESPPCMHGGTLYRAESGWTTIASFAEGAVELGCSGLAVSGDEAGGFIVSWLGAASFNNSWARTYTIPAGWGPIVTLSGGNPVATAVTRGHGWAVTTGSPRSTIFGVLAAELRANSGWQPFRQIFPQQGDGGFITNIGDGGLPPLAGQALVAGDDSGAAVVLWSPQRGLFSPGLYALRNVQGMWSDPNSISSVAAGGAIGALDLASTRDGHYVAIWQQTDTAASSPTLFTSTTSDGASWSYPTGPWYDVPAGSPSLPRIAAGRSGAALALWLQTEATSEAGDVSQIWAASRGYATNWSALALSADSVALPDSGSSLALVADTMGNGLAAWIDSNLTSPLQTARFVAARGWQSLGALAQSPPGAEDIHIAVDPWGRATIVWSVPGGGIGSARFE